MKKTMIVLSLAALAGIAHAATPESPQNKAVNRWCEEATRASVTLFQANARCVTYAGVPREYYGVPEHDPIVIKINEAMYGYGCRQRINQNAVSQQALVKFLNQINGMPIEEVCVMMRDYRQGVISRLFQPIKARKYQE